MALRWPDLAYSRPEKSFPGLNGFLPRPAVLSTHRRFGPESEHLQRTGLMSALDQERTLARDTGAFAKSRTRKIVSSQLRATSVFTQHLYK